MKVLYIGPYRDGTGWAHMAIESIQALVKAGADVVARPVKLNGAKPDIPPAILECEAKGHPSQYDVVIQNVLPHHMDFNGRIPLNVGFYCTETSRFDGGQWPQKINCMDRAWVCNQQSGYASQTSGVTIPYTVIPIACDISKYERTYKPLSIRDRLADSFIFYFIGEFIKRKNISALIQAFHLEFDVNEPVNLVIKTSLPGFGDSEYDNARAREEAIREIAMVKEAMKLYPNLGQYKEEIILVGRYTEEEIMRLHASCDCFICPSFGEAWCIPAFDAMAMGKTPIVTKGTGFLGYMTRETGWLVAASRQPVFAMHNSEFSDMYSSREKWDVADIDLLRQAMRSAYADNDKRKEFARAGKKRAYDFAHEKVGKSMMEDLSC
jgi:glycosyltransferase involved in cell wall biosynthesis